MEEMSFPLLSVIGSSGTDYVWEGEATVELPPTLRLTWL